MRHEPTTAALLALVFASAAAGEDSPPAFVEMPTPADQSYVLSSGVGSGRHWGRPEMVRFLIMVAREWKSRHPDDSQLAIGDISKPEGGPFPPHKTHQDGLAADITTRKPNVCHVDFPDQDVSLELARLMVELGARQILYNHDHVISRVPEVSRWEKHDDHFHVVVDPEKVPRGEGPLLVWRPGGLATGKVGGPDLRDEKGREAGLAVGWQYLAASGAWQKAYRVEMIRYEVAGPISFDTGWVDSPKTAIRTDWPLEHDKAYRLRVSVRGAKDETRELPWREFRTDLEPPRVAAASPADGEELAGRPVLTWTIESGSGEQAAYRIELDDDDSHARVAFDLGRVAGDAKRHEVATPLPAGRTVHWRVTVEDASGNAASTEWHAFKTSRESTKRAGRVSTGDLNFRTGPGTSYPLAGQLQKGDRVEIVGESGEWLQVRYEKDGRAWIGFVHSRYIEEE